MTDDARAWFALDAESKARATLHLAAAPVGGGAGPRAAVAAVVGAVTFAWPAA